MTKPKDEVKRFKQAPAPNGRPHRVRVQLTDEQLHALQQFSKAHRIGIPQILIEAYFRPTALNPRTLMRELAGVRRILTDEAEFLHELNRDKRASDEVWSLIQQGIQWRNEVLMKHYEQ